MYRVRCLIHKPNLHAEEKYDSIDEARRRAYELVEAGYQNVALYYGESHIKEQYN